MDVTILGSGCWEGTPAPFCTCAVCTTAAANPLSIETRTRPALSVSTGEGTFMIELSPDIRTQSTRHKLPPIDTFLLSHWHFDHLFGLYELHAWIELVLRRKPVIYCSSQAQAYITEHIGYMPVAIQPLQAYQPFTVCGVQVTPLPVYHMHRADDTKTDLALNNTFGFLLEHDGKKVAYLADYYRLPERTAALLQGADTIICDGTYLFEEQYPNKPYQNAILQEHDPDHMHGNAIVKHAQGLGASQVVYHSISHLPEQTHEALQALLPPGHMAAFDGMVV